MTPRVFPGFSASQGRVTARRRVTCNAMKWVVFATAPDQITAEMWRDLLQQAGVRCDIRASDTSRFLGVSTRPVRLIAPEEEAESARALLDEHFSVHPEGEGA